MLARPILIIIVSLITAIYAVINIYRIAIYSIHHAESMLKHQIVDSTPFLILNPVFWFWTVLAWLSAYLLIKNYLVIHEHKLHQS